MRKVALLPVVFVLVGLIFTGSASAASITLDEFKRMNLAPTATVDGVTQSFSINPVFADGSDQLVIGYTVPEQTLLFGVDNDQVSSTGASFVLFDPVITAAIGVVDFGAASNFAVSVISPLAPPITGLAAGTLSISGSFADGASNGGSATPFLTPLIAQATIEGAGVADAGPAKNFSSPSDTYGPYNVAYNFDCSALGDGQCDSFDLQIAFTGSGGSDAISFTARHEINAVPVPAAVWLFGSGLLGLVGIARRKKS